MSSGPPLERDERIDLSEGFGTIVVKDWMGSDAAVVQAARISYGKGTKTVREDRGLIRYLMRNRHTSPFEQCELKLLIRCPMDVWRQWIRHRTASVNEYSTRYSEAIDAMLTTPTTRWRLQSGSNKQGSGDMLDGSAGLGLSMTEKQLHEAARAVYADRLEKGVAREQARKDLPLSTFTEAYWKIDLHNLLHFLKLRMDPHAQLEIRSFAVAIGDIVRRWVPLTWEAFTDYHLNAMTFSRAELQALARAIAGRGDPEDVSGLSSRERREFLDKLARIEAAGDG